MEIKSIKDTAREVRKRIITSIYHAGAGHPGPSLSCADILTSLYFKEMKGQDICILSKGHAAPAVYATLSLMGEIDNNELKTLREIGSRLQGHPVADTFPQIKASTGSLGQGLSFAWGYSAANKLQDKQERVYAILGDGECQEGQVWEAAMSASKYANQGKLSGLTAIIDRNGSQGSGTVEETMPSLEPLEDKWKSFGWYVQTVDGHNIEELCAAYKNSRAEEKMPSVIIANTIKGKGISFMEKDPVGWHAGVLDEKLYNQALKELGGLNE